MSEVEEAEKTEGDGNDDDDDVPMVVCSLLFALNSEINCIVNETFI